MSNILLDISRLVSRLHDGLLPTGVDRVGLAYIKHYGGQARAVLSEKGYSITLSERASQSVFDMLLSGNLARLRLGALLAGHFMRPRRHENDAKGILLHTSHSGMEFGRYYAAMKRRNVRCVFMIHDLIPLTHAEYCRPNVNLQHRRRIHTALSHADGLILNSTDTLRTLEHEVARAKMPMPASTVARLASGVAVRARTSAPLDTPYFLVLGTIEPRKNHWFMLHVWRRMIEKLGAAAPRLVIVGRRGWECENVIDMLERCESLRPHVIELSDCSDAELQSWMGHARALLFPSFVEGYGMPLVEALAMKTPVLASNLRVFEEIAGDIPDYLDPLDGPAWIERILDFARPDSSAREAQLRRIEHFREPTWDEHFERVDTFLESLNRS